MIHGKTSTKRKKKKNKRKTKKALKKTKLKYFVIKNSTDIH